MTYILLLCAVFALLAFIHFLRRFSAAWAMRGWRRTQGRVLMAEMRRGKMKTADGCIMYDPVLRYSYTVGDHTFEGSRFTHEAVRPSGGMLTQFIARLTQGSELPVYYHPGKPEQAVVQPLAWQGAAVASLTCALLMVLLAAGFWLA